MLTGRNRINNVIQQFENVQSELNKGIVEADKIIKNKQKLINNGYSIKTYLTQLIDDVANFHRNLHMKDITLHIQAIGKAKTLSNKINSLLETN